MVPREGFVEMRLFVQPALRKQFKAKCTIQGLNMSEVISAFIDSYINDRVTAKMINLQPDETT